MTLVLIRQDGRPDKKILIIQPSASSEVLGKPFKWHRKERGMMGKALLVIGMTAMGMAGLYLKIEYSGWVLAVGLICAVL